MVQFHIYSFVLSLTGSRGLCGCGFGFHVASAVQVSLKPEPHKTTVQFYAVLCDQCCLHVFFKPQCSFMRFYVVRAVYMCFFKTAVQFYTVLGGLCGLHVFSKPQCRFIQFYEVHAIYRCFFSKPQCSFIQFWVVHASYRCCFFKTTLQFYTVLCGPCCLHIFLNRSAVLCVFMWSMWFIGIFSKSQCSFIQFYVVHAVYTVFENRSAVLCGLL